MAQKDEIDMLEYARFHGLARNYLVMNPLVNLGQVDDCLGPDEDLAGIPPINEFSGHPRVEKLAFSKDALLLLESATKTAQGVETISHDFVFDTHRIRSMKQEVPEIRTDHELDMMDFGRPFMPDLQNNYMPMILIDEEADEGLTWPFRYKTLPTEFTKKSESESLAVSSDALVFLRDTLQLSKGKKVPEFPDDEVLTYTKVRDCLLVFPKTNRVIDNDIFRQNAHKEPLTPNLLPLSPVFSPVVPFIDTNHLELPSPCSSPTNQDLLHLDRLLEADDYIIPMKRKRAASHEGSNSAPFTIKDVGDFYSPLRGIENPPSSPPIRKASLHDRKVEGPLTPIAFEQRFPSEAKSNSTSKDLLNILSEIPLATCQPDEIPSDDVDIFCEKIIAPIGVKVEQRIEQEQLLAADTEQRVPIPVMDFSRPLPPWKALNQKCKPGSDNSPHKKFLSDLKKAHLSKHSWPAIGNLERQLRWNPFLTTLASIEAEEGFQDDGSVAKFLEPDECNDHDALTWKPEGLRILDWSTSDDEDIDITRSPQKSDLDSLVRRRELQKEEANVEISEIEIEAIGSIKPQKPKGALTHVTTSLSQRPIEESKNLIPESFSALNAIENFMFVRNAEEQKPSLSAQKYFSEIKLGASQDTTLPKELGILTAEGATQKNPITMPPLLFPQCIVPSNPGSFVVSTIFIHNRKLARRVQRLYPRAILIERDFALHSVVPEGFNIASGSPSKQHPQPHTRTGLEMQLTNLESTMADEADMILSPGTGLLWTNLQKIKQRSLPGQISQSTIRDRITRVAKRYERLIILISGGNGNVIDHSGEDAIQTTLDPITDSDCTALAEFMAFCSTLREDVQALFVPGGDEQLAQWIVATMARYCSNKMSLMQDETLWELFLRRAGMNAFAAQTVLCQLRPSSREFEGGQEVAESGLKMFVNMSLEERLRRFEGLLGGRSVLIRVSERLDVRWA